MLRIFSNLKDKVSIFSIKFGLADKDFELTDAAKLYHFCHKYYL